jgi:hypothetical protein
MVFKIVLTSPALNFTCVVALVTAISSSYNPTEAIFPYILLRK